MSMLVASCYDVCRKMLRLCFLFQIVEHPNCVFELITKNPTKRANPINAEVDHEVAPTHVHLKGQMMFVGHWQAFIYLASPV